MDFRKSSQLSFTNWSLVALFFVVLFIGTFQSPADAFSLTGLCIRNCGHCKEIYGGYFNGQACAESCLLSSGNSVPDCNNPATFNRFIRMYI